MMNVQQDNSWFRANYDKWMAAASLLGLLASLLYLAARLEMVRQAEADFDAQLASLQPEHPYADIVDVRPYRKSLARIRRPARPQGSTNAMFVPEPRVSCVRCEQPIPADDAWTRRPCLFCGYVPPPRPPDLDVDKDGILDSWEVKHGLNPANSADAQLDPDNDGFTNIEEFRAETNPTDATDSPLAMNLHVESMTGTPFPLRFTSVTEMPDNTFMFGINDLADVTYFKKLGQTVRGYTLARYEPKIIVERHGRMQQKVDVSILAVRQGEKEVALVKGRQRTDHHAKLVFSIDNPMHYSVSTGDSLKIRGQTYEVAKISGPERTVVLQRPDNRGEWIIRGDDR